MQPGPPLPGASSQWFAGVIPGQPISNSLRVRRPILIANAEGLLLVHGLDGNAATFGPSGGRVEDDLVVFPGSRHGKPPIAWETTTPAFHPNGRSRPRIA